MEARVLEVATGPGYVALGFAEKCREVVGVDLTHTSTVLREMARANRPNGLVAVEDLSGTRLDEKNGALCFTQRTALVIGRRLARRQS